MEIREYVKAKRRWLPALVAVPVLAVLATVGYVAQQPPENTATVRAYVPQTMTNNDAQIGLYIARLNEGLMLDTVRAGIAASAHIDPNQLVEVAAQRSGQSDQFTISVVTTMPWDRAVAIAETATKVGTAYVARQSLQGADVSTELARQNFNKAQNDMFAYQDEIKDLDPTVTYNSVSRQLLDPDPGTNVAALKAQQQTLVQQVRRYNELKSTVQTTSGTLGANQAQSIARSAEIVAAESGSQILSAKLVADKIPGMRYLESAGLTFVLAFIAVLGLSLLPDLLRRRPTSAAVVASGGSGTPGPSTPGADLTKPVAEPRLTPSGAGAHVNGTTAAASASGSTSGLD